MNKTYADYMGYIELYRVPGITPYDDGTEDPTEA